MTLSRRVSEPCRRHRRRPGDILLDVFNKEKRQAKQEKKQADRERRQEVKEQLSAQIKARPTHAMSMERKERRTSREETMEVRENMIADRLRAVHSGQQALGDVTQIGAELLYLSALSGMQMDVHDQMSRSDRASTRWTVHGRHDKEFLGMAPTNRTVRFGGTTVTYLDGENITQEAHYWDMVALLQQIQAQ